jgi:hypothetical protein
MFKSFNQFLLVKINIFFLSHDFKHLIKKFQSVNKIYVNNILCLGEIIYICVFLFKQNVYFRIIDFKIKKKRINKNL